MKFRDLFLCLAVAGTLACAGVSVTGPGGTGGSYNPSSFTQLEDNLDKIQQAMIDLLENPEKFFKDHPNAKGVPPDQIMAYLQQMQAETIRLKEQVNGSGGGGSGGSGTKDPGPPQQPATPPTPV